MDIQGSLHPATSIGLCRTRDLAAKDKAAAAEAKDSEEDMQANIAKLQKQIDKAAAERNAAEGRSQRSAASLLKVKADLAALEIKFQVRQHYLLALQPGSVTSWLLGLPVYMHGVKHLVGCGLSRWIAIKLRRTHFFLPSRLITRPIKALKHRVQLPASCKGVFNVNKAVQSLTAHFSHEKAQCTLVVKGFTKV